MSNYNFKVDLKGIIRLLSDNLYSSDNVFLRELLQNAVDAIQARKKEDSDFKGGKIDIIYQEQKNGALLIFKDNGIGLNKEEIHSFLSVIGQSSKRSEQVRQSFIGQFGIGLLSCFLVTNEIKVITKSIKEEQAYQWVGKSDGTYKITERKTSTDDGTEVHLKLTGRMYDRFDEDEIIDNLYEYGFLISSPIYFHGNGWERKINDIFIPWRQPLCTAEQIMEFGEHLFEEQFFDMIPLIGEGIKGYAFISTRQVNANTTNRHKIFLKNMFITEDGKDVIPKWAFFTRCILNVEDLTPTASREGFSKDYKLIKVKNLIEKCIFDYFVSLSQYDVRKLKQLTSIHNIAIKSLAVENEQIFKLFFPFLTFPTNKGTLTGFQIMNAAKKKPVSYCMEIDDFRRICPLLEGTESLLINAGYIYDTNLLQQTSKYYKNVNLKLFEDSSYENLLETPPADMLVSMEYFLEQAGKTLEPLHCGISLKNFSPQQLPALYVPGDSGLFDSTMDEESFSSFFEGFDFSDEEENQGAKLYLNCTNSLVKRLHVLREPAFIETVIQVMYVQALLAGHYALGNKEMEMMNKGLIKLMEYGIGGMEP
ncbi:MAG: HSP90 family protein [Lachnospiraceae bacterium]|jgi:Molecular chaperone, HSP90 family|nr:HSP90 family protein [Lachnospiraceae bacterium]